MSLTPLPTPAPDRATMTQAEFSDAVDDLLNALPTLVTEFNADLVVIAGHASTASGAAATATTKALEAEASAAAATAVANVTLWSAATSYATGACVFSPTNYITYRRKSPGGVDATDPAADTARTYWEPISINGFLLRVVTGTTTTAANGEMLMLTNVAATTVTAPANPAVGDRFGVWVANGLLTNSVDWNTKNHMGAGSTSMTLDDAYAVIECTYGSISYGWGFKA